MQLINPEVRIETDSRCNSNCIMCPRSYLTRAQVTMGFGHFKNLCVQAKKLGAETIALFGFGEPLLDKTIAEKVALVTTLGMESFITTNASLLTERVIHNLLDAGLTQIRFSVHGLGDTYNKTHVGLSWKRTVKNITKFLSMNTGCTTHVSVIPMNNETVEEIRNFWEFQVDYLEIWRPHNWSYGKDYRKVRTRKKSCGRPFSGPIQINSDGNMMVCCFDFDAKMTVGNTYENTIEEILKGKEFDRIRTKHKVGDLDNLPCNKCDQLNEYTEEDYPLLYSNRDADKTINVTSSTKFKLTEN
jgi:radical SAM protein with 4Fe4S-binding SPASM domain